MDKKKKAKYILAIIYQFSWKPTRTMPYVV
jgi:hypothetical protein